MMPVPIRCGLFLCPPEREDGQMDGLQDETKQGGEAATQQPGAQDDGCGEAAQTQIGPAGDGAAAQTGATGLPNAGAGGGEEAELRRWREITGLDEK